MKNRDCTEWLIAAITIVIFLGLVFASSAHAQTAPVCTLDLSAAVAQLFAVPASQVLAQAFSIGLFTPLSAYLAAYCVGVLVNMFNR